MRSRRKKTKGPSAGVRSAPRATVQFTVRNVPSLVDRALRRRATAERRSLNDVLVEALQRGSGVEAEVHDDLDHLAGTWQDDPGFDAALAAQDVVDDGLWR